jgi:hypothetical protein
MTLEPTLSTTPGYLIGNFKGHISPPPLKEEPKVPDGIHLPSDPLLRQVVLLGLRRRGLIQ